MKDVEKRVDYIHSFIHSFDVHPELESFRSLDTCAELGVNKNTENNAIFFYCHEKIGVVVAQLPEIENRFSRNDHDVPFALVDITLSDQPTSDSFDLVARYYNLVKELLQADQRLFS